MPERLEGPNPPIEIPFSPVGRTPSWTSGDVLLWLKRFFSTDPRTRNVGEARPISWCNDYLSPADPLWSRKRDVILSWARCRANKESFSEMCRGRGWPPAAAYRLRDEAAGQIARGINEAIIRAHRDVA